MFALLQITKDQYTEKIFESAEDFFPTLEFGLQMLLLGMGTVFAVLTLLWGCLSIFKIVFYDMKNKSKASETTEKTEDAALCEVVQDQDDDEIVAVIAAAIAASENENPGLKFRVVAFNRK